MKFLVDTATIGVDSVVADSKLFGNLLAEVALREEAENFFFAFGKLAKFVFLGNWRRFAKTLDDLAGDAAAHRGSAFEDFAERFKELFAWSLFEKVAGGSGFEGFEDAIRVFIDRDHDELDLGELLFEAADAFHSIHAREVDVGEDDIGFVRRNSFEGILTIIVQADEFETFGPLNPVCVDGTQGKIVLDDGDSDVV